MPITQPYRLPTNIVELQQQRRKLRGPQHSFHLRHKPFQIQPFMIAPVLPAETMKNALLQARVVTEPIKNPLIGWWIEYYLFYVKLRDLDGRDDFSEMMIDFTKDLSAYHSAADVAFYHNNAAQINWQKLCLKRVTEEYFRDEGEAWDTYAIDTMPITQISGNTYLDSVIDSTVIDEGDLDPEGGPGSGESAMAEDVRFQTWNYMRQMQLVNMSFEDWLASFGIKGEVLKLHRPELLRYVRDWSYPTNTIDPSTGTPSSAVSWAIAERADKDRFFQEPGFIFGVTVARPKVYLSGSTGAATSMLEDAFGWMPAVMRDNPQTSLKKFVAGEGPVPGSTNPYWVDLRDLYIYGDQFVNFALTATDAGMVALPTVALQKRYPASADVDALFVGASPTSLVKQDGVVNLKILGQETDVT